jgi:hypothetical protein
MQKRPYERRRKKQKIIIKNQTTRELETQKTYFAFLLQGDGHFPQLGLEKQLRIVSPNQGRGFF